MTIYRTLAALFLIIGSSVTLATPFYQMFLNPDGSPQTNAFTFTASQPANTWTVVGSNIVYGNYPVTFTPDTNGYVSNSIAPNSYVVTFAGLNSGFYANIPNTTNVLPLANYVTNVSTVSGTALSGFGLVTNWLGYLPGTNGGAISYSQLPWTPPTNNYTGITNALGFWPATNSPATNVVIYLTALTLQTNSSGAVTNIVKTFATNTLNYQHP